MIHNRKTDKFHFKKIRNFCSLKDDVKKMKRQTTDWEKIFVNHASTIYKESSKFIRKVKKK